MTRHRWAVVAAVVLLAAPPVGSAPAHAAGAATAATGGPVPSAPLTAAAAAQPSDSGFGEAGDEITDRYGVPVWDYRVGGRQAGGVFDVGSHVNNVPLHLSSLGFWFVKFLVVALVWLLGFALDFSVATTLLTPVVELIGIYQSFVDRLGLVPLALMLSVFWFGLLALRGRVGRGVGEIAMSFTLLVLLGAVLAAPGATLLGDTGLLGRAKDLGSMVALLPLQDPSATPVCAPPAAGGPTVDGCATGVAAEPPLPGDDPRVLHWIVQTWLVDMYVRQPHQYIMYGQRLDCPLELRMRASLGDPGQGEPCRPHPCLDRYNEILRTDPAELAERIQDQYNRRLQDPPGARFDPQTGLVSPPERFELPPFADAANYLHDMMDPELGWYAVDDSCGEHGRALAAYNRSGDWGRVGLVVLVLVALVILLAYLLGGVVLPLVVGQVFTAVLAVALVFVLPVALVGSGRRLLWKWLGLVLAALLLIVMSLFGLSLMLVAADLLLRGNWQLSISLVLVCVLSLVFLKVQRGLLQAGSGAGTAASGALAGGAPGGGAAAAGAAAAAGGAWSRPAAAGLDLGERALAAGGRRAASLTGRSARFATRKAVNTATLAPLRRRWSRRRALRKQTKAQLAAEAHVYKRNPKLVYKRAEAKRRAMEKWQKKRRRR
ncbi:MAG TPA: hypothetical protein VKY81_01555 [Natronosporangium sp.]|nr:hypothetical protein [Natronosporangium sp.]